MVVSCFFSIPQEMLEIMKSIYDMMGRYTYPCVRDDAPSEHVDKFFQVLNAHIDAKIMYNNVFHAKRIDSDVFVLYKGPLLLLPTENGQKQRWRGDHRGVHRDVSEGDLQSHIRNNVLFLCYKQHKQQRTVH